MRCKKPALWVKVKPILLRARLAEQWRPGRAVWEIREHDRDGNCGNPEIYELRPADLLEIRGPEKNFMIPYVAEMIQSVSVAENRIVLDPPPGLLEV